VGNNDLENLGKDGKSKMDLKKIGWRGGGGGWGWWWWWCGLD
jgi:hypothetical protein